MAPRTKSTSHEIDDETLYSVSVIKRIEINRNLTLRRGSTATLKGRVLREYLDYVGDIQPVTQQVL